MESAVNKTIEEISDAISSQIEKAMTTSGTKLSDFKVSCTQKLKTAANQGAEKFKEELTNQIGKTFGDSDMGKQAGTDAVANFTSWRYSDYLTLFLMISLFKNEHEVINRIVDVIQMNMEKKEGTISDTGLSDGAYYLYFYIFEQMSCLIAEFVIYYSHVISYCFTRILFHYC